jgi:exosortase A
MAQVWWRSDTFAHGMVVYPISLWLVWRMRSRLQSLPCGPSWLGLGAVALVAFGWLLGELAGVLAAQHLGFVMLIACSVWALLGTPIARALAFPLAFSLLAVPIGEFMLPLLIEQTADFTVGALRLTGIPVYREGNNFVIPTGHWSVVEACSGLRYLIASVTLGLLYAYISYTSLSRRLLFVVSAIAVPIVANWVRAYMIVMIGHLSGMKYAVGVDHLLYGWVFFGIVMMLLFWLGSAWREDTTPPAKMGQGPSTRLDLTPAFVAGAVAVAAVAGAAPLYAQWVEPGGDPGQIALRHIAPVHGWVPHQSAPSQYRPNYVGARSVLEQTFEKEGRSVGVFVAYYSRQRQGAELIMGANTIRPMGERAWVVMHQRTAPGMSTAVGPIETHLGSPGEEYLVWHAYWAGGRWVARPELVKALQAYSRLLGRGDDAAVVAFFTPARADIKAARGLLQEFHAAVAPSLRAMLAQSHAISLDRVSGRHGE